MASEIFRCIAGSRLFGTTTATSDTDYKAVHVPDSRSILLGTANAVINKSTGSDTTKNNKDDTDLTSFPLYSFLKQVAKNETNAVEMLFAPNMVADNDPLSGIWNIIYENRFKLLTNERRGFVGFGKDQAMRYAVRGDRLDSLERLIDRLEVLEHRRICDQSWIYQQIMEIPGVTIWDKPQPGDRLIPHLSLFGREISLTIKPAEAIKIFSKPLREAGYRTTEAQAAGGADWKGLYHAQRIVDEGIELMTTGQLVFPNVNALRYRAIRQGCFSLEDVLDHFEASLQRLIDVQAIPELRETADMDWIEDFVVDVYRQQVR